MKQFLRYQVSGMVFVFWAVVFYLSSTSPESNLINLIKDACDENGSIHFLVSLLSSLPIGVVIHQISVSIKNCIVAKWIKEFDDFPVCSRINSSSKMKNYIFERISNLNSFYYVRFDNGILAPFAAWLSVWIITKNIVTNEWAFCALVIGGLVSFYIFRIQKEIKEYNKLLDKCKGRVDEKYGKNASCCCCSVSSSRLWRRRFN